MAQQQPAATPYEWLAADQLDNLTARAALYPDALLSEIFVAATYPLDVVEASQWLAAGNNPATVDQQPWDPSVKGLTRFPAVLNQMASDASWTNDLGAAFLNQKADLFASVQRLRAQAIAAGTLYSTPQQQVVQDAGVIQIIPSDPGTIYAPSYDPAVVYDQQNYPVGTVFTPPVTFVYSAPVGPWLGYDCDWDDNQIYIGDWGRDRPWWHWHDRDWHYDNFRPGHFDERGHNDWKPSVWGHDDKRDGPRFQPAASIRPDRHAAPARPEPIPGIDRGFQAERDAQRGRSERLPQAPIRANEGPVPAREAPSRQAPPARELPHEQSPPVREQPRREAPPAREEPPAFHYQPGADSGHESQRGAESRGGSPAPSAPAARGGGGAGGGGAGGGGGGGRR